MRYAVAGVAFVTIFGVVVAILRMLASPPPSESERVLEDVSPGELAYKCSVCGTEVRVTRKPQGDVKPPRHCGEAMEVCDARE